MKKMKYEDADFTGWPTKPSKKSFEEWQAARKFKHKLWFSSGSLKWCTRQIIALDNEMVSATQAFEIAAVRGWQGITFDYVMSYIAQHQIMPDLTPENNYPLSVNSPQSIINHSRSPQSTRAIKLDEELTNQEWAKGLIGDER